jgi:hypothetical protein
MGILTKQHIKLKNIEFTKYAQYDKAIKINFVQKGKRKEYYSYFYSDLIIYDGFVDYPKTLLNNISIETKNNIQWTITKSKLLSCDKNHYKLIIEYFKEKNIKPIVNTTDFH